MSVGCCAGDTNKARACACCTSGGVGHGVGSSLGCEGPGVKVGNGVGVGVGDSVGACNGVGLDTLDENGSLGSGTKRWTPSAFHSSVHDSPPRFGGDAATMMSSCKVAGGTQRLMKQKASTYDGMGARSGLVRAGR